MPIFISSTESLMPVASVLTFFLDDCSVLTISERTRASITQASDAVFVPAKSRSTCFHLVTAVATVDDLRDKGGTPCEKKADKIVRNSQKAAHLPNNFITLHAVALPNLSRL